MKRKVIAFTIALMIVSTSAYAYNQDIPSDWATEYITKANELDLIPHQLNTDYTQAITRAEFCALAVKLYETITEEPIQERMQFVDSTDINVEKMGALGIVNGVGGNRFNPDGTLTREQAATIMARLAEELNIDLKWESPTTFIDVDTISRWAFDAVGQMRGSGIMGGIGNNTFSPHGTYTREQSITTILRLHDAIQEALNPIPSCCR